MSRRPLEARPRIALDPDGELVSETLLAEGGACAQTLSTNLCDLGVELHLSYVGHMRAATTHVAELVLRIGEPAPRPVHASCATSTYRWYTRADAA